MSDDLPIFKNKQVVIFGEIQVDEGSHCVFRPWLQDGREHFGWEASIHGGRPTFIYIAPILDNPPDSEPTFYLFIGPHGDPDKDYRLGPYDLKGGLRD
jgi:hypothetical protein